MRHTIVHAHIFKNAGSTLDWSLKRTFGERFVDHREDAEMRKGKFRYLREYLGDRGDVSAISSHSVMFAPEDVGDWQFHFVYILRDPVARARSVYEFERRQLNSPTAGARMAKQLGFRAFIDWYLTPEAPATVRNGQAIFCAQRGLSQKSDTGALACAMVTHNRLVGIVERYDESMVLLERHLRPHFADLDLAYIRQNVSNAGSVVSDADRRAQVLHELGDTASRYLAANALDLALYETANRLLDRRIAEIGDFAERLHDFKGRCNALRGALRA